MVPHKAKLHCCVAQLSSLVDQPIFNLHNDESNEIKEKATKQKKNQLVLLDKRKSTHRGLVHMEDSIIRVLDDFIPDYHLIQWIGLGSVLRNLKGKHKTHQLLNKQ
jgi:hypothetical protein